MPNRLANETSPYLLQHQNNPVDWYPWGDEALQRARADDKPILLSIGYSACHWCHVMERESFEDEAIAGLMNERFINIKVDREERPDLDGIYMQAVQSLTGRGGWPMTMFLLPDGTPFYGGTYFPPEERQGMPAFPRVLEAVSDAYRDRRAGIEQQGKTLMEQIKAVEGPAPGSPQILTDEILHRAASALRDRFDDEYAGFGGAPKFPNPMDLDLLFRYHHRFKDKGALDMATQTLRAMAMGGIYDRVGGGFHRYATDQVWLVPHFEKMLYDNSQLAATYLDAWLITGDPQFQLICRETLDYVMREMTHESGAFFSTQDADSEGVEGKFFVWTPAQIDEALGADAALIKDFYGVSEQGNFEGENILHITTEAGAFAAAHGLQAEEFAAKLRSVRERLYQVREQRIHPARDDKVLTSWNGMMLKSFARASRALPPGPARDKYLQVARANADFLLANMRPEGRLLRTWKDGRARLLGYLEDYACLIDGLLATYEATFVARYLQSADALAREMLELFWEPNQGVFYDTGKDHEKLVTRPRDIFDNASPAGNSVAIDILLRLAVFRAEPEFESTAAAALRGLAPYLTQMPGGFGRALCALDFYLSRKRELAIVWPNGVEQAAPLLDVAFGSFRPNMVVAGGADSGVAGLTPLLDNRGAIDGPATAYVCEGYACQQPVTTPQELAAQLA